MSYYDWAASQGLAHQASNDSWLDNQVRENLGAQTDKFIQSVNADKESKLAEIQAQSKIIDQVLPGFKTPVSIPKEEPKSVIESRPIPLGLILLGLILIWKKLK